MNPLEFLAAVLPSAGVYCIAELSTKKKEHIFTTNLQELQPHIERFNQAKCNAYFALASFIEPGKRTAENALSMRSLFLDIDCGERKAYPTKKAAVEALDGFLQATSLPSPWVISSGGGVHVYWPFTEHVSILDWKIAAENLKRLCKQHGLAIDFSVTADTARVLRIPGTTNWKDPKNPRPVEIRIIGAPQHHVFTELSQKINGGMPEGNKVGQPVPLVPAQEFAAIPGQRLPAATPSLVKVLENRVTFFKSILDRTAAGAGCRQLAFYLEHASDEGMEPLWRGLLSLAKACTDGDKASRFLSKLHPYTDSRMQTKLREIKGPYPCSKFDSENPGVCPQCPSWGKITNPLAFGHEIQLDQAEKQVEFKATEAQDASVTVTRPSPPYGYAYGAKGGVYKVVQSQDDDGNQVTEHKLILPYDLFVVDLLSNVEEGHQVQLLALRPEGPTTIIIPQRVVVSKDDMVKALAEHNIISAYGSGNDKGLFDYVRAAVENVSASRKAIKVPVAFGWQRDDTFVYSSKIYSPTGERYVPMTKLANIVQRTTINGTLDNWKRVVSLLISKQLYNALSIMLISFGSPLMRFTDYKGLTFHIGSSETGTGKSLSLKLTASVWGPETYIVNASTSNLAQIHRQGALGNLPLIIDEITEVNKNFEWLSAFLLDMTGGQGKDRMKSGTNEERINVTEWSALMLLASNQHVTDFLSAVRKKAAEGHLRRLLELKMDTILSWQLHERRIIRLLSKNYGVAGHAYAQWLVRNVGLAESITAKVYEDLDRDMEATGDERFWIAGIACCIAAGILISSQYANIVDLPMKEIIDFYKKLIYEARQIVTINKRTAEDILNAYTREFFGNFVIIRVNSTTKQLETSYGNSGVIDQSLTRSQVKGRVEHGVVAGHINYYIEEQLMKAWCSDLNYGYADFKRRISQKFPVTYGKKDLLLGTKGPQMRVNVIKICRPETALTADLELPEADENKVPMG